jgi:hypothetical protein
MATSPDPLLWTVHTTAQQVRKVREIHGDWVTYVARGKKATPDWEKGARLQTTRLKFGGEVVPCSCDWDPDRSK